MKKTIFIILCIGVATIPVQGQVATKVRAQKPSPESGETVIKTVPSRVAGAHELSLWAGYSFQSSNGIWGKTSHAQLSILGVRYNRKFLAFPKNDMLEYTLELNLLASYNYPEFTQDADRVTLSGFGLSPVGLQFNWGQNKSVQPFIRTAAGFLYLNNPFPDNRGVKFNFTLEAGGGLEFKITNHSSFTFGYKYHHMSNGERGEVNPGIDSNILYGAITLF